MKTLSLIPKILNYCFVGLIFMLSINSINAQQTPVRQVTHRKADYIDVIARLNSDKTKIHFPTCICCCMPCPCDNDGSIFDPFPIKGTDIIALSPIKLKDEEGRELSLIRLKNTNHKLSKDLRTYESVGLAHNAILEIVLPDIEKKIIAWKQANHKPTKNELNKLVQSSAQRGFKDFGFKGETLLEMNRISNRVLKNILATDRSLFTTERSTSIESGIPNKIITKYKISNDVVSYYSKWETNFNKDISAKINNSGLDSINNLAKKANITDKDIRLISSMNSVAKHSFLFWNQEWDSLIEEINEGTDQSPGTVVAKKNSGKEIVKGDVKGAVAGAAAGAVATTPAGGAGAVPGAVAGAIISSLATSVSELLDYFW